MTVQPDRTIYTKSPITEAVIDIRTVNGEGLSIRDLKRAGDRLAGYVETARLQEIQETFSESERTQSQRTVGLAYRSEERQTVVQVRLEGFACSKLSPYDRWESFRDHARESWVHYVEVAGPTVVKRLAVRFINRIPVPRAVADFRPYVHVYPATPWNLTSPPAGLFLQLRRPFPNGRLMVLNQTVAATEGVVAIILDFDVFSEEEQPFDDVAVWNQVEELHVSLEEAFEESITDLVREQIR